MAAARGKLFLRLTSDVNDRVRELGRYRGDLSAHVEEALSQIDLKEVEFLSRTQSHGCRGVTVMVSPSTNSRLRAIAEQRECSITALANSAINEWLQRQPSRALSFSAGRTLLRRPPSPNERRARTDASV
jgi:predicted transcriptional regulator